LCGDKVEKKKKKKKKRVERRILGFGEEICGKDTTWETKAYIEGK
jgi:hypothetical protein